MGLPYFSLSRYRLLESRLEETVQQTMKIKEEKISSLEKKVEESNKVNVTLLAELSTVRTQTFSFHSPLTPCLKLSHKILFIQQRSLSQSKSLV